MVSWPSLLCTVASSWHINSIDECGCARFRVFRAPPAATFGIHLTPSPSPVLSVSRLRLNRGWGRPLASPSASAHRLYHGTTVDFSISYKVEVFLLRCCRPSNYLLLQTPNCSRHWLSQTASFHCSKPCLLAFDPQLCDDLNSDLAVDRTGSGFS